ncbi:MAG TPA: DUF885 domain-containing protein, partial [Longimicrobiaceae bacterium]|nr:DUF885 domain-containing protein [Longimicrobiaceae bacterium]
MRFAAFLSLSLLIGCAPATMQTATTPARAGDASARLGQLFQEDWEFRMRESPLFATAVGDPRYNALLGSVSAADEERRAEQVRGSLARLEAIDRSALSREEQISYDIYRRLRENELEAHRFRGYLMPITNREGFHTSFPQLPDRQPLTTVQDYENYIARLRAFREYAGQHVELMRTGVREGIALPRVVLTGVEETIQPHIVTDPTQSLLWKPFAEFPASVPEGERERLRAAGREAIAGSVVPAYQEFLQFMTSEYVPGARQTIAARDLPNGQEYYEFLVRSYTTLDVTPEEVHQRGLSEVRRIRTEME